MAWVYTFDTATPVGTDNVSTLDDRARETKSALQERLNIDLYMPLTGTQVSDTSAGKHRKVQFYGVLAVKPTLLTGEAAIYIKTVTGKSELFFEDSDGTEKQLTSVGKLNIVAADISVDVIDDTKIELRNNQYLVASNVAGDADVSLIKANSSDVAQIPDGSQLATSAAPTADAQIANKKYVDDQIAAIRATETPDIAFADHLTTANTWQDLDLSGTVGAHYAMVFLEVTVGSGGIAFAVKPKGYGSTLANHTGNTGLGGGAIYDNSGGKVGYLTCFTDSAGLIQIAGNNNSTTVTVKIVGYLAGQ